MSSQLLFACSMCFKKFPYENLSEGSQACKVSSGHNFQGSVNDTKFPSTSKGR